MRMTIVRHFYDQMTPSIRMNAKSTLHLLFISAICNDELFDHIPGTLMQRKYDYYQQQPQQQQAFGAAQGRRNHLPPSVPIGSTLRCNMVV